MKYAAMFLGLLSLLGAACRPNASQHAHYNQQDSAVYFIDIAQSKIEFVSIKDSCPVRAFVSIQEGRFLFKSGAPYTANVSIDMNSLACDGKDSAQKANGTNYLMDTARFAVAQYPLGQFELMHANPIPAASLKEQLNQDCTHFIAGFLVVKGIRKSISFPAKLHLHQQTLTIDAYPELNFVDWGITGIADNGARTPLSIHLVAHKE